MIGVTRLLKDMIGQAGVIFALSLVVTGTAWWGVDRQATQFANGQFEAAAEDVADAITKRMADYEQILRGGVALFAANDTVTRQQWRTYIKQLAVEDHYPGILGIGFAARVPWNELPAHQEALRQEGFPEYTVRPAGRRPDTFPVVFIEPFGGRNLRAFGYDMFADPGRRTAMARARDTGEPAISPRVTLVQETTENVQAGTLLYLPVYARDADASTVEARQRAIIGYVYSPFRMDDLMTGTLGNQLRDLGVRIYDGELTPDKLLFDRGAAGKPKYTWRRSVETFGRTWIIDVQSRPSMEATLKTRYPAVVLGAGAIISLLLMGLARMILRERMRSLALARNNRDLAEARQMAEAARAEAEEANLAKSKFLAAASHDIRQPVQSIMLLLEVLGQKLAGHPASALLAPLDHSLDALRMLLNGMLDISKLDAGVIEAHIDTVELGPLLERLAGEYSLRAADGGLAFRVVASRVRVRTDRALLERILRNLIENALRYTVKGEILVGCRRSGESIRIEIHDTGIGIPAEQVANIFEEFHQVGNNERDRTQGLGLGLAIVRRLALMLDHEVTVRSRLGLGSCFAITLPMASGPEQDVGHALRNVA